MSTRQGVGTGRIVQTRAYTCRTCRVVGGRRRVFRKGRAVGQTPDAVASTKRHTAITRRQLMGLAAVVPPAALAVAGSATARAASSPASAATIGTYDESVLPTGIRSRFVPDVNGLRMHLLEAGLLEGATACNQPFRLASWTAAEVAQMPTYHIMELDTGWRRQWRTTCRHRPRSPPTDGCPKTSSASTARSSGGRGSRVACSGIGRAGRVGSRWSSSQALRSTSHPPSLPGRATGVPISGPAPHRVLAAARVTRASPHLAGRRGVGRYRSCARCPLSELGTA